MNRFKLSHLGVAAVLTIASASCSTQRSPLTYFTDIDSVKTEMVIGDYSVKIEPTDELFITVTSATPEATAIYNVPLINPGTSSTLGNITSQPQQQTYIVDSEGNIRFPQLGTIHVAGLTIEQLERELTRRISADVTDPVVKAEIVNFTVNVAGEVKDPQQITVRTRRYSVLDALAAAGDLTEYAERNNVLVIREINGKRISGRLDLNSAESLQSPFFYLKQNDYVYVEPNRIRKDNSKYNTNNSYKLQVVSTIVSGCSVLASLIIALTR